MKSNYRYKNCRTYSHNGHFFFFPMIFFVLFLITLQIMPKKDKKTIEDIPDRNQDAVRKTHKYNTVTNQ